MKKRKKIKKKVYKIKRIKKSKGKIIKKTRVNKKVRKIKKTKGKIIKKPRVKTKVRKIKKYKKKKKTNVKSKSQVSNVKKRFKLKKQRLPFDRIKKIKLPKLKFKKIKLPKIKIKKIKKKASHFTKFSFQKIINFVLTPVFRAYDNYFENKKLAQLKKIEIEKKEKEKKKKEEERLILEFKQRELKEETKLARERSHDLKKFIRQEQAILRKEQAEKRRRFLEEIKLEKKIESFRKRESLEIKNLEKFALSEQRDDYRPVEERIEKIKEKYRLIREQKIRERVQTLGVEISDADTKEELLQKEKEYAAYRETIESVLESFYRSANSLVFQLNKRYIPKHKSILRVIDRRYEENLCFIRYDDSPDDDWLILIYLEDSDAKKGKIIVENKTDPEKNETRAFQTKEIFTYSDYLVDAMTSHIDRERQKKAS